MIPAAKPKNANQNSNQVVIFDHGDIVGDYKLEQRLEYLGTSDNQVRIRRVRVR
jgi:hypothetical protein